MTKTSANARVEPESFMGQKAFNKNRANLAPSNRRFFTPTSQPKSDYLSSAVRA